MLKNTGLGSAAALLGMLATKDQALAQTTAQAAKGLAPLKITKVRPILTAPQPRTRFVVVKVETTEPGLYGLGCATFNQRPLAVKTAIEEYLDPFCRGRDADNIEDLWQTAYTSSYWRNGPVLNNALSGLDQALWDIKGKRAGMPVYQLLGGKCRFAVACYGHASGKDLAALEASVQQNLERGFRHIRIQLGGYGSPHLSKDADFEKEKFGLPVESHMDARPYLNATPKMFEHIRNKFGDAIELLHDVHERIEPINAINLCKELERYHPFFIEDPLAPEANSYFRLLRQQSSAPIAMGELLQQPARMGKPHRRTPHQLHPRSPLTGRRVDAGSQARRPGRVVPGAHRLAWTRRRLARGPRRQRAPGPGYPQLRHPGIRPVQHRHPGGLPRHARPEERLHVRQRGPGPGSGCERAIGQEVPAPGEPRLLAARPARRWDGSAALTQC